MIPGAVFISFLHPDMDIIDMENIHVPGIVSSTPAHELLHTRQPHNYPFHPRQTRVVVYRIVLLTAFGGYKNCNYILIGFEAILEKCYLSNFEQSCSIKSHLKG